MQEDKLMGIGIIGAFGFALAVMAGISPWLICAGLIAAGLGVAGIIVLMSLAAVVVGIIHDEMSDPEENELDEDSLLDEIEKHIDEINALRAEIGR